MNHRAALTGLLFALAIPAVAVAQPVTFRAAYNETVRGGLTMDGWGALSSPTTYAMGSFRLRIPRGGRVVWARLLSDVVMRPQDVETAMVPSGPAGSPREVIVGGVNGGITRRLEGRPDFVRTVSFTYGTFSTDVTTAVRYVVGSVAPGGEVEVPVRERGDEGPSNGAVSVAPVFEGHALAVVYELDYGPRRNLTVYEGNAAGTVRVTDLPLRSPVANRCPAMSLRGEAFPLSVALASEYSTCQENNPLTINGTLVSSTLGGADDWPDDPRTGCNGPIAGLVTVGSFGGAEAGDGAAAGAPVGLEGDSVTGLPAAPRSDDELYDARTFLADGVTRLDFNFGGDGDEVVMAVGLQSLARDQMTDADDDGFDDTIEGDCAVDTDRDGTPDYLDLDSDNDCRPDRMETAVGRTDAAMPGAPDANCVGGAPVCDRAVGVCGCRASADCPATTPVCDATARFCAACTMSAQCAGRPGLAVCATSGAREGQCVGCVTSAQCRAGETCDATSNACVGPADAGMLDAGAMDVGVADTGAADVGVADVVMADAGMTDTGSADPGMADAGIADTGSVDAGVMIDAGVADAGGALVEVMDDGCGCRVGSRSPKGGALAIALTALALLARRKARRRGLLSP